MAKGTEITKAAPVDLAAFDGIDFGTGVETRDASDMSERLPCINLVQNTSKIIGRHKELRGGQFVLEKDGDVVFAKDKMNVVVITVSRSRVMWPATYGANSRPLCRSFDGQTMAQGGCGDGACARCRYAKWEQGVGSQCKAKYTAVMMDKETGEFFRFDAKGASFAPFRDFVRSTQSVYRDLASKGVMQKLTNGTAPVYFFETEMSSDFQSNDKGNYYTVTLSKPVQNTLIFHEDGSVDREQLLMFNDMVHAYLDMVKRQQEMGMDGNDGSPAPAPTIDISGDDDDLPF